MSNSVRNFLAAMGSDLSNIDKSFKVNDYGDGGRNRQNAYDIEMADQSIRRRLGFSQPEFIQQAPQIIYNQTPFLEDTYNIPTNQEEMKPTREERINKLLGKNTVANNNIENQSLVNTFKKALEPISEQLEDIAVLNGLIVQRLEELIKIVDGDNSQPINMPEEGFQVENEESMEVYNPEVSMSLIDDEEEVPATKNRRKK